MYSGEFFFTCPTLSIKNGIKVREITVSQYLTLLKFIKNNNDADLEYYIEHLLRQLIIGDQFLHVLDKFIVLLVVRSTILGPEIYLQRKEPSRQLKMSIDDITGPLLDLRMPPVKVLNVDDAHITVGMPERFYFDGIDPWDNCIRGRQGSSQQTSRSLKQVQNYLLEMEEVLQDHHLIDSPLLKVPLKLLDNTLLDLLKLLLAEDLKSLYDMMFNLVSKAHFSWADILRMNPAEMQIFLRKLNDDNAELEGLFKDKQQRSSMQQVVDSLK